MTFKPGDLVMVVKPPPCCGIDHSSGKVFAVHKIVFHPVSWCECGHIGSSTMAHEDDETGGYETSRLRLIPPIDEPEFIAIEEPQEVSA